MTGARRRHVQQQPTGKTSRINSPTSPPNSSSLRQRQFGIPLALTAGLFLISYIPRVQQNTILIRSFWVAVLVLIAWQAALIIPLNSANGKRGVHLSLRPQHYLQGIVQIAVFVYWGYFWRPVYDHAWLLIAQILFAYAFDILLSWSRQKSYTLGFGPFPIIFSTNLFLWFRDDWFYLQFLMLAVGFLGKEFVRWQRDGKTVHIFNPSALSLGLFSLILITTDTTHLTWGQEIATTLTLAPRIYLFLFLIGLVVMYFFSITLVAGSAAIMLFGSSALYSAVTGVPYFIDSEIPSAVFLGLHLLVTDPSTSPRTSLGKTIFGMLYGIGVFALYSLLGTIGAPTFYDKLLCVPLLNLGVQQIDRLVRNVQGNPVLRKWRTNWTPASANLVHMVAWVLFFATMTAVGATDGRHRGDSVPFWEETCTRDLSKACQRLIQIESNYCRDNAGWACNELGRHYTEGTIVSPDAEHATTYFAQACELRFQAGCFNLLDDATISLAHPRLIDLRLLLREAGPNLLGMPEAEIYSRACSHGWSFACERGTR